VTDIAAVVLAAGSSTRFGADNKLLAPVDGKPLLGHVLEQIAGLPLADKIVVVRPGDEAVISLVGEHAASIVENHDAADGMGTSIAAGVRHAGDVDGVLVILGDMPFIRKSTCLDLLAALREHPDKTIVVPTFEGRRGHPVLFRRAHFGDLMALDDDTGAQQILAANAATLLSVPTNDAGILADVDVPAYSR
jgi:molybdenum cofactor cytidylyltransferase